MIYAYKCPAGHITETVVPMGRNLPAIDCYCGDHAVRCYRCENKNLGGIVEMKKERDPGYDPTLFLPTKKDFKGPNDPDGEKGMNAWMERHRPADTSNGKKMLDPRKL